MRRLALPALVVIALAACAGGPGAATAPVGAAATLPGSTLQASGFLGDYSSLSKVPGRLDTWQWGRPGTDWKSYTRIMVMPIEVWINPQAAYPGIQPDVYKRMTDSFRAMLTDSFRMGGYQIVDQPGPGVLRLHIALTGVTPERPGLGEAERARHASAPRSPRLVRVRAGCGGNVFPVVAWERGCAGSRDVCFLGDHHRPQCFSPVTLLSRSGVRRSNAAGRACRCRGKRPAPADCVDGYGNRRGLLFGHVHFES